MNAELAHVSDQSASFFSFRLRLFFVAFPKCIPAGEVHCQDTITLPRLILLDVRVIEVAHFSTLVHVEHCASFGCARVEQRCW